MTTKYKSVPQTTLNITKFAYCKLCPKPIESGEERIWLSKPMGLSHVKCVTKIK